jgi:Mor family transcriptional regulator
MFSGNLQEHFPMICPCGWIIIVTKYRKRVEMFMSERDFENLNGIYDEIKNAFGIDVTLRFYSMFKGQQITFPMYLFDKKYIAEKIREEYDGSNGKELAKKYGYSERHIREIAKK